MRHGAAEATSGDGDEACALTARGAEECRRLAAHLRDGGLSGDRGGERGTGAAWNVILCSSARRARQSAELLAAAMAGPAPPLDLRRDLYLASAETLLAVLHTLPESAGSVLLVAHNPGLAAFTRRLAGAGGGRAARPAAKIFPPGALAHFACETQTWAHLAPGDATLSAFITPKDLS